MEIDTYVNNLMVFFDKKYLNKKNFPKKCIFKICENSAKGFVNYNIGIFYNEYDQSNFGFSGNFSFKKLETLLTLLK